MEIGTLFDKFSDIRDINYYSTTQELIVRAFQSNYIKHNLFVYDWVNRNVKIREGMLDAILVEWIVNGL